MADNQLNLAYLHLMEHLVLEVVELEIVVRVDQVLLDLKEMVVMEQEHLNTVLVVVEALVVMVLMPHHLMVESVE